jgi:hypothetical protein
MGPLVMPAGLFCFLSRDRSPAMLVQNPYLLNADGPSISSFAR